MGASDRPRARLKDIASLFKETFSEWNEDKAPRLAAALSYYTIFSLAPLLVIVIAVAGLVLGPSAVQDRIVGQIAALTGSQESAEMIQGLIASAYNPDAGIIATIIAIAVVLFGATGVFGQLHESLNTIWEVAPKTGGGILGLIKDRFLSFTMVLGVGFLLLVSFVIDALLSVFSEYIMGWFPGAGVIMQVLNFSISFGVITLLFAMIYRILPDVQISWSDVGIGAAFTAFLFVVGRELISLYLGTRGINDTYGAAGSIVVLLLWIYYSSMILFFGAEFTQVYARRYGTQIIPERGATPLTEEARAEQGIPHLDATGKPVKTADVAAAPGQAQPGPGGRYYLPTSRSTPASFTAAPPMLRRTSRGILATSTLLVALASFISGMVVMKGGKR